jgi:Family of unknown function (DUF6188)
VRSSHAFPSTPLSGLLITSETHVGAEAILGSPFVIVRDDDVREHVDPRALTPASLVAIHGLLWLEVATVELLAIGELAIRAGQLQVRVAPHNEYQAWEFLHSNGLTAWAGPGGEISYSRPSP